MHAVKTNQPELFLPSHVQIIYLARFLFPAAVRDWILYVAGIARSMDHFQGQRRI